MVKYSSFNRIMNARDLFKNGASSKSLMSIEYFRIKQFLGVLLLLMLIGCSRQKETVITVEFPDQPEVNTLFYSEPISGINFVEFRDTLKANETGKFELKIKITQPSFVSIWVNPRSRVKLLVEPGNNYHVFMELQKNAEITGANEKGQMLYATLSDTDYIERDLEKIGINIFNISDTISLIYVHNKINELKQSEILKFKELLDRKEITKSFFDLVKKDRDCYYASLEAVFSIIKTDDGMNIEDDLLENLTKIYDQYPPNDKNLLFSSFWREYAKFYVTGYKQYIQDDFDVQKLEYLEESGMYNTHIINEAKKYLNGKALEFFQAQYFYIKFLQVYSRYEKEFITLFEQFEKDYPKSGFSRFLKPYVDEIIDYFRIIEQPFDKDILLIDNYENINTLEDAIKPLRGKKIYIDVWGTWCNPCIREFTHNETLKKILAENNIQPLYISIRDDDDQKWRNAIKHYHLTGAHIRANQELFIDLERVFSKDLERSYISIPWYILIDEEGNIMEERAKSPSQLVAGEELWQAARVH